MSVEKKWKHYSDEHGIDVTFEALDTSFRVVDYFEGLDYVPNDVGYHVLNRMSSITDNWIGYLHQLLMPNPKSMIAASEADVVTEETEDISHAIDTLRLFRSQVTLAHLTRNDAKTAQLVEEGYGMWMDTKPFLIKIANSIVSYWEEEKNGY